MEVLIDRTTGPIVCMSQLLGDLIERLENQKVAYCHWKGNFRLDRLVLAEDDLDLLAPGESEALAVEILRSLGFIAAIPRVEPSCAASRHFYGYDANADVMVHVHLYGQVLTGENFIDSHRLPFEKMLLRETRKHHGVRVPGKAAESIVFVLKTYIRYGSLLDWAAMFRRPRDRVTEWTWLDPKTHLEASLALLAEYCPDVDPKLYTRCVNDMAEPGSQLRRLRLAITVRRQLRRYERRGRGARVWQKLGYLARKIARDIGVRRRGKILADGGRVVAVVSPEESDAASAARELNRWLGAVFSVRVIDAHAPAQSPASASIRPFLPLVRHVKPNTPVTSGTDAGPVPERRSRNLAEAAEAACLARDRRRALVRARRGARRGQIVITNGNPEATNQAARPDGGDGPDRRGVVTAAFEYLARVEMKHARRTPAPDVSVIADASSTATLHGLQLATWEALRS